MANHAISSESPPNEEGEVLEPEIGQPLRQEEPEIVATLEELKIAQDFIEGLRNASLDDDGLDLAVLENLRDPIQEQLDLSDKPGLLASIELFIDTTTASEQVYSNVCKTFARYMQAVRGPQDDTNSGDDDDHTRLLSHYRVKQTIAKLTGVHSLMRDMCPNTCIAYTGPFSDLEACPKCSHPRYDPASADRHKKIAQRQFYTIPLGPQLQALWRSPDSAKAMRHRSVETHTILENLKNNRNEITTWEDIYHGTEYLDAVRNGRIKENDMVLLMSIDGAQLYQSKESDCWIYIWVVLDLAPDLRYKKRHIFPGGFIPGPNNPENVDSFIFPGLHHLSALMKEGLMIWDSARDIIFKSYPFMHLGTADGPGATYLNGLTGHSGAFGCRIYCPVKGRRKGSHYYPALLKPANYDIEGSNHADVNGSHLPSGNEKEYLGALRKVLQSNTNAIYEENRKETGISKPSIFSGFPRERTLGVPNCFGADLMHLVSLNLTELLLGLWRGNTNVIGCDPLDDKNTWDWAVLTGEIWKRHGQHVENMRPYLPGSFDRPPRNPAKKISSGYKAWEYLTYVFGLGPAVFRGILPDKYWRNLCKLIRGIRLIQQRSITKAQLLEAHKLLVQFVLEFEELYYQRKAYRLHFCRQSVHALLHLVPEIIRLGPGIYYTQWAMERTIGNLGEEIKQPSQPFANLSERGLRRSQTNALKVMLPYLDEERKLPRVSIKLGHGYILLGARDKYEQHVCDKDANAVCSYLSQHFPDMLDPEWKPRFFRWARLHLPNGQIVRSLWKEKNKLLEKVRISHNVMVSKLISLHKLNLMKLQFHRINNASCVEYGEIQYFFQIDVAGEILNLALVSVYSRPNVALLEQSSGALWACCYTGQEMLEVIPIENIRSCVAMPPLNEPADDWVFVCEKMGLEVAEMGGVEEEDNADDIYL